MQTRRMKLLQHVHQQCSQFHVDVTIKKHKDIKYYKNKWKRIQKRKQTYKYKATIWETQLLQLIRESIYNRVTKYHEVRDVVVLIPGVPKYMWKRMTRHWEVYVPQRRKPGYMEYRKTHKTAQFLAAFPGTQLDKQVTEQVMMRITIGTKVAARALYNSTYHQMIISFYYEPYPFPLHWVPMFKTTGKVVGKCKHYLYLVDKIKTKRN